MIDDEEPVLAIEDLEVRYSAERQKIVAVTDLSIQVSRGECFGLVGESGCGKSTVAMAIMRHLGTQGDISEGRVLFQGQDMALLTRQELRSIRGARISMVYQNASTALNPTKTAGAQLSEVLHVHGEQSRRYVRRRVRDMLTAVGIVDADATAHRFPHQLSGGQQQRVLIAMAFLVEPELLILDEPTTALDVTVEAEIMSLLGKMRSEHGTTMLFISHNLGLVGQVCESIGVMYAGNIIEQGPTSRVLGRPKHPYTRGLIACMPRLDSGHSDYRMQSIPGQVPRLHAKPQYCAFMNRCVSAQVGVCDRPTALESTGYNTWVRCHRWRNLSVDGTIAAPVSSTPIATPQSTEPILRLKNISKTYGDYRLFRTSKTRTSQVRANDSVSLELMPSETLGIVGESGCGKSTLARIILGLEVPSNGHIIFQGCDVSGRRVERRRAEQVRNLQIVFQDPDSTLNPSHSVGYILSRAVKKLGSAAGWAARQAEVERLLDLVRLPHDIGHLTAARLSGGQKQRVAVARAFAGRPALVVADEPTSALDTSVQTAILDLLLSVQRDSGTALIFISHDLAVVRYISDRVAVMYLGQIVESGQTEDVFAPPHHPYTETLLAAVPALDKSPAQQRPLNVAEKAGLATATPTGCPFAPRCHYAIPGTCDHHRPPALRPRPGHLIRCHLSEKELMQLPQASRSVVLSD